MVFNPDELQGRRLALQVLGDSEEDRERWLKERMSGLGASDVAAVFPEIDGYCSPYTLWCIKTGKVDAEDADNEYTFWGRKLERAIIEGYAERTGRAAVPFGLLVRNPRWPWLSCTPDGFTTDYEEARKKEPELVRAIAALRRACKDGRTPARALIDAFEVLLEGWWPVQTKNVGAFMTSDWVNGAPAHYRVQCQQEAMLLGCGRTTAAALTGGNRLIYEDIALDPVDEERIVNLSRRFWFEHVEADVPPPVDASESTENTLKRRWPSSVEVAPEKIRVLSWERLAEADEIERIKAECKALDERRTLLENRAREEIAELECAVLPDGSGYALKTVYTREQLITKKAGSYRTLRRTWPKAKPARAKKSTSTTKEEAAE